MKKLAILVLCIRLLYGCSFLSSTQKAPPPTLKAASFDYAPSQTTTSAQPIKIAIINPSFAKSFAEGNQEP
ncbi:MAG: hypothetical protein K1X55_17170, partial [Chitinophagales bacterium]|nr:hypothetical protein [Chitinophagales bacterium]